MKLSGGGVTDSTGYYGIVAAFRNGKKEADIAVDISKTVTDEESYFSVYMDVDGDGPFPSLDSEQGLWTVMPVDKNELREFLITAVNRFAWQYHFDCI
jgi:hypothetical protein